MKKKKIIRKPFSWHIVEPSDIEASESQGEAALT